MKLLSEHYLAALLGLFLLGLSVRAQPQQSSAPPEASLAGEWEMYLAEDGRDPRGTILEYPVAVHLRMEGSKLTGRASFPEMQTSDTSTQKTGPTYLSLRTVTVVNNNLSFRIEGDRKSDFAEVTLQRVGERFEGRWKALRSGEGGTVKMIRKYVLTPALLEKIVGEWTLTVLSAEGNEAQGVNSVLEVKFINDRLVARTMFEMDGEKKEWLLIEPRFDGETFYYKVNNGDEWLEATLKLSGDRFEGPWKASGSGAKGTMKLTRKK